MNTSRINEVLAEDGTYIQWYWLLKELQAKRNSRGTAVSKDFKGRGSDDTLRVDVNCAHVWYTAWIPPAMILTESGAWAIRCAFPQVP